MADAAVVRHEGLALPGNEWNLLDGRRPDEPALVSVVIAHYEQQTELDRTLLALGRQSHPAELLDVIVVDDGSRVPPVVGDGVRLVVQDDQGFRLAAARNAGATVARGSVLCFLDADTVPEPDYVREATRLPALAPDVVTVGRRRHASLSSLPAGARVEAAAPTVELPSPAWLTLAYQRGRNLLDADSRSYRHVIGAVVSCDAEFFRETGGFDETFTSYGGEDWEWAYRAWLTGALLAHVPEAVAWHDGPEWAGRPESMRNAKNDEAIRLATRIPVPGSGPRGLRGDLADVVVALPGGADPKAAAWFVATDSLAAALPLAALPGDPRSTRLARILVDVARPLRVSGPGLAEAIERVERCGLGEIAVVDAPGGTVLCTIRAVRADARARRWGRSDLHAREVAVVEGVTALDGEIDVEGYLGGWA